MGTQMAVEPPTIPSPRRELVWVPIVHTPEDMGGLRSSVESLYIRRLGKARWDAHLRSVADFWTRTRRWIDGLELDYRQVRLYQDGLPICGHEEKIVRELAVRGSPNHRLLVGMIDRGAHLTGTESPQLLLEEYDLNRRLLGAGPAVPPRPARPGEVQEQGRRLLEQRDDFIATRIAETLRPSEHGLIFLGMLHSLEGRLPADIHVTIVRPESPKPPATFRPG